MKRTLNKNIIVFIMFGIMILAGLYGECIQEIFSNTIEAFNEIKRGSVNTAINTAMQDGSGTEDKAKIRSMIQEIEDPELRRDLEKTSTALLTAHSEKVQPTSKLGKLLSMAKPVLSFVSLLSDNNG